MNRTLFSLLFGAVALVLAGCGASVDGGDGVFTPNADIQVGISVASGDGTPGTNMTYTVIVTNAGPRDVTGIAVASVLDDDGLISSDAEWTCAAPLEGSCSDASGFGDLSANVDLPHETAASFTIVATVGYSAGGTTGLSASAGEDPDWPDPDLTNNVAEIETAIGQAAPLADFNDEIIYWALTDRFSNGDAANDNLPGYRPGDAAQPGDPGLWHGGDFAGFKAKIEEGYFQSMGFTALWISPVVFQVPQFFSTTAYHGYWAEDFSQIESHFGTLEELQDLVGTAHANGLKIILDVVVNHYGYDAQLVNQEPDWFRLGAPGCDGTNDFDCSIAGLPDLVHEDPEVKQLVRDNVANLLAQVGVDGIRWDAAKHVNTSIWGDLVSSGAPADRSTLWSVGEVFDGRTTRMAHYLDRVGMPSVFDFPLYGALDQAIASRSAGTDAIGAVFAADTEISDATRLTTFVDNHDVDRFVTRAIAGGAGATQALERLDAAVSLIYGARGIPQIYYGTEIGLQGTAAGNLNRADMEFALCAVEDQGLDNTEAYGATIYVRGTFNGWANPPPPGASFTNFGGGVYKARFRAVAGDQDFKVATADWSTEFTVDGAMPLDAPTTLQPGGGLGNTTVAIPADGCYDFTLDTTVAGAPVLTITRVKDGCGISDPGLDNSAAYGDPIFARGSFNGWADPPPDSALFYQVTPTNYQAEFTIGEADHEFKVAKADWSVEFTNDQTTVTLGDPIILEPGGGKGNTKITIEDGGCYNFDLDVTNLNSPVIVVSKVETAGSATDGRERLAALGAARSAYPALQRGDQAMLYDPSAACEPAETGNDPAEAFGTTMFARGSFNGWADPAPAGDAFANRGNGVYEARVLMTAASHEYKVAAGDWSIERAYTDGETPLDTTVTMTTPAANGQITITEDGCYGWTMDASDTDSPALTVTQLYAGTPTDVLAFSRTLAGEATVVVVLNNDDEDVDLSTLPGGGIPLNGAFADGAQLVEITGEAHGLSAAGGNLVGTIPARTTYLFSDQ
jgi:uncharacterized repeat protein (TIGR01451 family)